MTSEDPTPVAAAPAPPGPAAQAPVTSTPVDEALLWRQLQNCFDPEIPVNIVDLGLIYDLELVPQPLGGHLVNVRMTLTAPGCGMGPMIVADVQQRLLEVPGVTDAKVELVFDPPWNQDMMTEAAKLELGLM